MSGISPESSFPSMTVPTFPTSDKLTVPDQLIYLSLLSHFQQALASQPQLLQSEALLHLPSAVQSQYIDPLIGNSVAMHSIPSPSVSNAPPSPPSSPERSLATGVSPLDISWKHEEEAAEQIFDFPCESPPAGVGNATDLAVGQMSFEDYVRQVESGMTEADDHMVDTGDSLPVRPQKAAAQPKITQSKGSRSRRTPLTPEELSVRRDKNLQAARRCRLRKALRVRWLEARCEELEAQNARVAEKLAELEKLLEAQDGDA